MQEESTVNYGLALKVYRQRAQGRSMNLKKAGNIRNHAENQWLAIACGKVDAY